MQPFGLKQEYKFNIRPFRMQYFCSNEEILRKEV